MFFVWFKKYIDEDDMMLIEDYKFSQAQICQLFIETLKSTDKIVKILKK